MGIKGIYGEIGPGKRIALAKLAVEKYEQTGRPLRIAIDISIWLFQVQSGQGGPNPALRTLYYRLLRLMYLSVQPLFVFDGPQKPSIKRNKQVGDNSESVHINLTKKMLRLFGFPIHIAPGEAEAECAFLQQSGLVDAVLSEDVDTLMFGCGLTFRNWSSDEVRGNHAPTHVSVYDTVETRKGKAGLDRESMILIALMSGGDYNTEGIPGCGIKVACEAAKAGFGTKLCRISTKDKAEFDSWREELAHEIQTNEHNYFRVKHKTMKIPMEFPDTRILSLYTNPIISTATTFSLLKADLHWDGNIDVPGLRQFVAERFEWTNKRGAKKFIRGLAPALLVSRLIARGNRRRSTHDDVLLTAENESKLVKKICGRRTHFSTDGIPELRLLYVPADIVGLNIHEELDDCGNKDADRNEIAIGDESDGPVIIDDDDHEAISSSPTKRAAPSYDPTQPGRIWVAESIAKLGIPLQVEDYEESLRAPKTSKRTKKPSVKVSTKGGMQKGALDRYLNITKPNIRSRQDGGSKALDFETATQKERSKSQTRNQSVAPPKHHHPSKTPTASQGGPKTPKKPHAEESPLATENSSASHKTAKGKSKEEHLQTNPWTLSQSTSPIKTHRTRASLSESKYSKIEGNVGTEWQPVTISSSSPKISTSPSSSPSKMAQKHPRPTTPPHLSAPRTESSYRISPTKKQVLRVGQGTLQIATHTPRDIPSSPLSATQEIKHSHPAEGREENEDRSPSLDPSLPSLNDLITSASSSKNKASVTDDGAVFEGGEKNAKRFVMLRESLEGAWKKTTEEEKDAVIKRRGKGRKPRMWRESEVEVLDMTSYVGLDEA